MILIAKKEGTSEVDLPIEAWHLRVIIVGKCVCGSVRTVFWSYEW